MIRRRWSFGLTRWLIGLALTFPTGAGASDLEVILLDPAPDASRDDAARIEEALIMHPRIIGFRSRLSGEVIGRSERHRRSFRQCRDCPCFDARRRTQRSKFSLAGRIHRRGGELSTVVLMCRGSTAVGLVSAEGVSAVEIADALVNLLVGPALEGQTPRPGLGPVALPPPAPASPVAAEPDPPPPALPTPPPPLAIEPPPPTPLEPMLRRPSIHEPADRSNAMLFGIAGAMLAAGGTFAMIRSEDESDEASTLYRQYLAADSPESAASLRARIDDADENTVVYRYAGVGLVTAAAISFGLAVRSAVSHAKAEAASGDAAGRGVISANATNRAGHFAVGWRW